jgi:hypothetical protein
VGEIRLDPPVVGISVEEISARQDVGRVLEEFGDVG